MKRAMSIFILLIFLTGQYAVLATDVDGKEEIEVPETHYPAVASSETGSSFDQSETAEVETVKIVSAGSGIVATIRKNIPVLERQPWVNITSNVTIDLVVKKEGDRVSVTIKQPKWQDAVKSLWEGGARYAYLEKELVVDIDNGQATFILYRDFSIAYQEADGNVVEISSPLDDIEITSVKVKEDIVGGFKDETWDLNRELEKVLAFYGIRQAELAEHKPLATKQYEASKTAFEETSALIDQTYQDPFVRDFLQTSFIARVIETIVTDEYWTDEYKEAFPNEKHPQWQDTDLKDFQTWQVKELVRKLLEMEHFKSYERTGEMGWGIERRLEPLLRLTYQHPNRHGDPILCEKSKNAVEQLLNNALAAGELGRRHLPVEYELYDDWRGPQSRRMETPETLGGWFGEPTTQIDILKGLLVLERMKAMVKEDGSCEFVVQDNRFSTKRLLLAEALAFQYVKNDQLSDALATVEQLEEELVELEQEVTDEVSKESILGLKDRLKVTRSVVTQAAFKRIVLDLSFLLAEVQKIDRSRSSWAENVINDDGSWSLFTAILDGGYLTYFVNEAGIWDEDRARVSAVEADLKGKLKGVSTLQSLAQAGVKDSDVQRWLSGKLSGNELAAEMKVDDPKITERHLTILLDKTKENVARVYNKSYTYYPDLEVLLEGAKVGYGEDFTAQRRFLFEEETTKEKLKERIAALGLSGVGKIFNFVDHGLNPIALLVSLFSGGVGGSLLGVSVKGVRGAAFAVVENVVIDTTAGSVLVASGFDPYEHVWMVMGATMGIGIAAGAGFVRMSKSFRPDLDSVSRMSDEDLLVAGLERKPNGMIADRRGTAIKTEEDLRFHLRQQNSRIVLSARLQSAEERVIRDALVDVNLRFMVGKAHILEIEKLLSRKDIKITGSVRKWVDSFLSDILTLNKLRYTKMGRYFDPDLDGFFLDSKFMRSHFFPDDTDFVLDHSLSFFRFDLDSDFVESWNNIMRARADDILAKEEALRKMLGISGGESSHETILRSLRGKPLNKRVEGACDDCGFFLDQIRPESALPRDNLREIALSLIEWPTEDIHALAAQNIRINVLDPEFFARYYRPEVKGLYYFSGKFIDLQEGSEMLATAPHELGHALHYTLLDAAGDRDLFRAWKLYQKKGIFAPSIYGATNPEELFAESIAAYFGYVPSSRVNFFVTTHFVGAETGQAWLRETSPEMFLLLDRFFSGKRTRVSILKRIANKGITFKGKTFSMKPSYLDPSYRAKIVMAPLAVVAAPLAVAGVGYIGMKGIERTSFFWENCKELVEVTDDQGQLLTCVNMLKRDLGDWLKEKED